MKNGDMYFVCDSFLKTQKIGKYFLGFEHALKSTRFVTSIIKPK